MELLQEGQDTIEVVTVAEAAGMLGMAEQSVRRLIGMEFIRSIPAERPGGIVHRLVKADVEKYRDKHRGRIGRPSRELDGYATGQRNDGRRYRGHCLDAAADKGMTAAQFAESMGVDPSYVYMVDGRTSEPRNPSPAYRLRAAEVLGLPVDQLFSDITDGETDDLSDLNDASNS